MAWSFRVPLITEENRKGFFWPAAFYLYFSYTLTGSYAFFTPWHPYHSSVDAWVPFLPGTIWIYLSHIGMLFTGWWWMVKGPGCTRAFCAVVLGSVIATFYFFFFPTELPRRELVDVDAGPVTQAAWAFLMQADNPTNSFPSMHVALSAITAIGLMRSHPRWGWLAPVWTAAIAVSTLTTEQHVLVDVLGGIGLAVFCLVVVELFVVVGDEPARETARRGTAVTDARQEPVLTAAEWRARGTLHQVLGHDLFVVDEGPRDAPVLVLLHGFPSASYDFWRVLPALTQRYRVIVHDHVGFGFSVKPRDYSYSILDQAEHALALWQQLGITQAHLLAHDYGCSVATEIFYRRSHDGIPLQLRSATMVNSGLYYHMAGLRLAQHLLRLKITRPVFSRLSGSFMFKLNMRRLWGTPGPELDAELDQLWRMIEPGNGKPALGWLSHYLEERRWIHTERWNTGIRSFDAPAQVLWGDLDPVGIPAIAERLARELPQSTLTWLPGVGHYPMLEAPADFAAAVLGYIDRH